LFGVIGALALVALPAHASATPDKPPVGVTVSPFKQEITIRPTDVSQSFEVRLGNNTQYIQELNILVVNFGSLDETGGLLFAGANANNLIAKYGLADWVELDRTMVSLKPGEKTILKGRINNRDSLSPGGHYAAVLVSARVPDGKGANQVNFKQSVSSLLFAKKMGGEHYDLRLDRLTHDGTWWKPPTKVTLRFYNPGNVFAVPRGIVKLLGPGNALLQQGVINEDSGYVLPEAYRQVYVRLRPVENKRWWVVRSYRLGADYRYDGMDRFANKSVTLRVVNGPVAVALALVILVSCVGIVFALRKLTKKRRGRKAKVAASASPPASKKPKTVDIMIRRDTEDE
jgi:hypothetical protein